LSSARQKSRRSTPGKRRAAVACAVTAFAASALLAQHTPTSPAFAAVGVVPHVPEQAVQLGRLTTAASGTLELDIVLKPSRSAQLLALATAVSTPGSARYRRYLTPAQVSRRFGASRATVAAVTKGLRQRGLHIAGLSANRLIIRVTGSAAEVEHALGVALVRYRLPNGDVAYANDRAPTLPRAIAARVASVVGLSSFPKETASRARATRAARHRVAPRTAAAGAAGPQLTPTCSQQITQASETYAQQLVSSSDLAQVYGVNGLYAAGNLGQGATVALIEFSSFISSDIGTFAACFGITPHINEVPIDGGTGAPVDSGPGVDDQIEAELDIEAVLGLAPDATIDVYEAPQAGNGPLDVFSAAIANPDVEVISTSWGRCEAQAADLVQPESTLFQEAAAEGKTIVAASGDSGSEDCYGQTHGDQATKFAVDDPAGQPFITGVGGTTFLSLGPPASSAVWNLAGAAGGGGVSSLNPMPSYQSGAAPALGVVGQYSTCASGAGNCREVPDVSADAGTPFATFCTEGGRGGCDSSGWTGFRGTSLAAPVWGAIFALADTSQICTAHRIGFANPLLYAIAGGTGYASAFTDVTQGNNDLGFNGGLYTAAPGYDLATGLGTPITGSGTGTDSGLVDQLCGVAPPVPVTTVTGISPDAGPLGGGVRLTIKGSGLAGATAVSFGKKAAITFAVVSDTAISAVAPPGAGKAAVTVTTPLGTSKVAATAQFAYLGVPAVDAVSPATGPRRGGTKVTVTGTSFVEVTAVRFGARKAASFRILSPTRISAVAPPGSGSAPVVVVTPGGASRPSPAGRFHYP
jgi:subtilase family serine protease